MLMPTIVKTAMKKMTTRKTEPRAAQGRVRRLRPATSDREFAAERGPYMTTVNTMHCGIGKVACAATALLCVSNAQADGVCIKNYRDTTQAERETITATLDNVKNAMPPAPEGWVILGDDQVQALTSICRDGEREPWPYHYTRYYQRVDDQEARNRILQAAVEERMADMQAKQQRLDAIMARNAALTQELIDASQKGDYARAETIRIEMDSNGQEYQAVMSEGGIEERMHDAEVAASRDQSMTISVAINSSTESPGIGAEAMPLRHDTYAVFRSTSTRDVITEDNAVILLGQWQLNDGGYLQTVPRPGTVASAAHTFSIHVAADPGRFESVIDAIDFDALTASLTR